MSVASRSAIPADPPESAESLPPLRSGDRLTRAEFERRYEAMPNLKRAELIEGEVHVPSPVSARDHGKPNRWISYWLEFYERRTPGVFGADNCTVRLDLENVPQPDTFLMIVAERGGRAVIGDDGFVEGAPEFIVEIAASCVTYDLGKKLEVYRRNGVREYVVWRVRDKAIDWFVLTDGRYDPLAPSADGIFRSNVFPGLWLDAAAMLRGDQATVLAVVQAGVDSPEHADFVGRLAQR